MRTMRLLILTPVALLALAACSKPAEKAATAPAAAPGVAASAATGVTGPKAGLWKQSMTTHGQTITTRICLDAATGAKPEVWTQGKMSKDCSKSEAHRGLDGSMTFESVCAMPGGGTMTTKGKATGDFNSHYTMTVESRVEGAAVNGMNGANTMAIDAAWQGPCPADWKAGEVKMSMPGGQEIDSRKLEKLKALAEKYKQ